MLAHAGVRGGGLQTRCFMSPFLEGKERGREGKESLAADPKVAKR